MRFNTPAKTLVSAVASRGVRTASIRGLAVIAALAAGLLMGTASAAAAAPPTVIIDTSCGLYYLSTDYGLLRSCTQTRAAPGITEARTGLYSPHNGTFSWKTGWLPAGGKASSCVQTEPYKFYGGRHMATAYGAASWGVEYNWQTGKGQFGWFNWHTRRFSPDTGQLPAVLAGHDHIPRFISCTWL
jgi:hypothetical protein